MSSKAIENTLSTLFSSAQSPPLSDAVVDAFLASPAQASEEIGERVMALFARRVIANLHKEPVKKTGDEPFGRWIETVRRSARLAPSEIGSAIGKDEAYVERLESGRSWPWELDPKDIGNLICLFRVHIQAVSHLVQRSFALSRASVTGNVVARAHKGRMTKARGDSTKRALDMFLARNAKLEALDDQTNKWLSEVSKQIEDCQAQELLN